MKGDALILHITGVFVAIVAIAVILHPQSASQLKAFGVAIAQGIRAGTGK